MKAIAAIFALVVFLMSAEVFAQNMCATQFGSCQMAAPSPPGGPCYCVTPAGPVQGFTQGPPPAVLPMPGTTPFPSFCCTPAGRLGPYPNASIGPGQVCSIPTPAGIAMGQACY